MSFASYIQDLKESTTMDRLQRKGYETNLIAQLEKDKNNYSIQVTEEASVLQRFSITPPLLTIRHKEILNWAETCKTRMQLSLEQIRKNPNLEVTAPEEQEQSPDQPLTLSYLLKSYNHFQENYMSEWCLFDLVLLSFHLVFPLVCL